MPDKEVEAVKGTGCDVSAFGGQFVSKRNKQSKMLLAGKGDVLVHNITDDKGKVVVSREFVVGGYARIVRGLPFGAEIDEAAIDIEELSYGRIEGFWTCLDGKQAEAVGAELSLSPQKVRLPLRILLPMEAPARPESQ